MLTVFYLLNIYLLSLLEILPSSCYSLWWYFLGSWGRHILTHTGSLLMHTSREIKILVKQLKLQLQWPGTIYSQTSVFVCPCFHTIRFLWKISYIWSDIVQPEMLRPGPTGSPRGSDTYQAPKQSILCVLVTQSGFVSRWVSITPCSSKTFRNTPLFFVLFDWVQLLDNPPWHQRKFRMPVLW